MNERAFGWGALATAQHDRKIRHGPWRLLTTPDCNRGIGRGSRSGADDGGRCAAAVGGAVFLGRSLFFAEPPAARIFRLVRPTPSFAAPPSPSRPPAPLLDAPDPAQSRP